VGVATTRRVRLPGAVELPWARRRRLKAERGTVALGVAAFSLTAVVLGGEVARVLRERVRVHPELDPIDSQTSRCARRWPSRSRATRA
jgi:hypothetical protein